MSDPGGLAGKGAVDATLVPASTEPRRCDLASGNYAADGSRQERASGAF